MMYDVSVVSSEANTWPQESGNRKPWWEDPTSWIIKLSTRILTLETEAKGKHCRAFALNHVRVRFSGFGCMCTGMVNCCLWQIEVKPVIMKASSEEILSTNYHVSVSTALLEKRLVRAPLARMESMTDAISEEVWQFMLVSWDSVLQVWLMKMCISTVRRYVCLLMW